MTATEQAYKELIAGLVSCNSIEQIKSLIKQVLNIDENHLMFDAIVRKLCDRSGVDYYDNSIDTITNYLHTLEGKLVIRSFNGNADLKNFAITIVDRYNVIGSISMAQFKKIAMQCGYVIGPNFKSTRKLSNLIESNM